MSPHNFNVNVFYLSNKKLKILDFARIYGGSRTVDHNGCITYT
jgi:hypothetical protein